MSALDKISDIYQLYWGELCGFVRKKFGSGPPDPEDIAQSVFLKVAAVENMQQIDNIKSFLFRTASNLVIDHHRSPKNWAASDNDVTKSENSSDVSSPEFVFMSEQELKIVEQVIMSLPERDRAFVLMNRLDGLSYTEIAEKANMSRSGVQKIIMQSLEKCHDALKHAHKHC